ncbi:hypothetical protein [Antarctobacter jejuensis]|uniref:hypothetical protein n=1 Tax=Antarctobacter jejuensis TaxID=1439938 RepID=UPI003FD13DF5
MVFLIPVVALSIGLGAGWIALRMGRGIVAALLALMLVAGILWMVIEQEAATGLDGLTYALIWFLMLMPALLGLGVGSGIGHWRRIRRRTAEAA